MYICYTNNTRARTMGQNGAVDEDDGLGGVHAVRDEGQEDGVVVPDAALLGLFVFIFVCAWLYFFWLG